APAQAAHTTESRALEANKAQPAPGVIEGEPIIWVHGGAGAYTPEFRAARITRRIDEVVHDRTVRDIAVTITEVEGVSELRAGSHLLMTITPRDAALVGVPRVSLAQQ